MPTYYADASALVKLIRDEPESAALDAFLGDADLVSSELVLTEVPRAMRRTVGDSPASLHAVLDRTADVLGSMALRPLDPELLVGAGALAGPALRSLDAIHVMTATELDPIDGFITYDKRQAAVARMAGLATIAPGI